MQLPVVLRPEPGPSGWPGVRHELWRASRVKLFVLFVLLCWTVGVTVGGPALGRTDARDLSVVPGEAPTATVPGAVPGCPGRLAVPVASCGR